MSPRTPRRRRLPWREVTPGPAARPPAGFPDKEPPAGARRRTYIDPATVTAVGIEILARLVRRRIRSAAAHGALTTLRNMALGIRLEDLAAADFPDDE